MTDYEKLTDLNYLSAAFNKSKKDCAWKDSVQKVEFSKFFLFVGDPGKTQN